MTYPMSPADALFEANGVLEAAQKTFFDAGNNNSEIEVSACVLQATLKYTQSLLRHAQPEPDEMQDYNELIFAFRLMGDVLLKVLVPPQFEWVEVEGNALSPSFRERDIAFYDPSGQGQVSDGYYVVQFEDGPRVMRLQALIGENRIVSIYEDERFTKEYLPEDKSLYKVLGPVIGCIKRF